MIIYKNHWCEPNSAETCLQSIYELAIDYDGYRDADNLMDLIDEMKDIALEFKPIENIKAPVDVGEQLADVKITFKNQLIFSDKIYSIKYIRADTFNSSVDRIINNM